MLSKVGGLVMERLLRRDRSKGMKASIKGFTIVELLIVIVIIGILAAIVIVAYNGVSARANDTKRITDMKNVKTAIESYYAENGSLPNTNYPNLSNYLVPKYLKALPVDSVNATVNGKTYAYYYTRGYKKSGSSYIAGTDSDYIISMSLETGTGTAYGGYAAGLSFNWIDGN